MCKVTHITLSHYTLCESTQFFPFGGKPIYTLCLSCHSIMSAVTRHYIVPSTFCQLPILLAEINEWMNEKCTQDFNKKCFLVAPQPKCPCPTQMCVPLWQCVPPLMCAPLLRCGPPWVYSPTLCVCLTRVFHKTKKLKSPHECWIMDMLWDSLRILKRCELLF